MRWHRTRETRQRDIGPTESSLRRQKPHRRIYIHTCPAGWNFAWIQQSSHKRIYLKGTIFLFYACKYDSQYRQGSYTSSTHTLVSPETERVNNSNTQTYLRPGLFYTNTPTDYLSLRRTMVITKMFHSRFKSIRMMRCNGLLRRIVWYTRKV